MVDEGGDGGGFEGALRIVTLPKAAVGTRLAMRGIGTSAGTTPRAIQRSITAVKVATGGPPMVRCGASRSSGSRPSSLSRAASTAPERESSSAKCIAAASRSPRSEPVSGIAAGTCTARTAATTRPTFVGRRR